MHNPTPSFLSKKHSRSKSISKTSIYSPSGDFSPEFINRFLFTIKDESLSDISYISDEDLVSTEPDLRYDVVKRVISVTQAKNPSSTPTYKCLVEFHPRPSGFIPNNTTYSSRELKKYAPRQLAEYYESKLLI